MKKRSLVALILIIAVLTIVPSGCGKKEVTLESFVKDNPSEYKALEEKLSSGDPNAKIEFEGNIMRFIYTVDDPDKTKEVFDQAMEKMVDTFNNMAKELSSKIGIEGIQIEIVYADTEGKTITSRIFE